jgi:hypothetical protein
MQPPNHLARFLFTGMIGKHMNPLEEQELIPENLLPSLDMFPRNHPASDNPDFNALPQDVKEIIINLNADFQPRKLTLRKIRQLIVAFRFDSLQLHEGFRPLVPPNALSDLILKKYADNAQFVLVWIFEFFMERYLELHELTKEVLTVTPEQWLARVQVAQPANDAEASQ